MLTVNKFDLGSNSSFSEKASIESQFKWNQPSAKNNFAIATNRILKKMRTNHLLWASLFAMTFLGSTGCTVGPKFVKPQSDIPSQFDQANSYAKDVAQSQVWAAFGSVDLNALLLRADQNNKTIEQAKARLNETRALSGLSKYSLFPTVTAGSDAERTRSSNQDPFVPSDIGISESYRAGFDASWEIDLFGSLRNQKRAIVNRDEADFAALQDVRLAIRAEVAQAYFSMRGEQQRLKLQQEILANLQNSDRILEARLNEGRGSALELAQNRTLAFQVAAQVPNIEAEVVRHEQRLSVLTAQTVVALRALMSSEIALPELPSLIAIGTPQDWMQRRPDIRAAERRFAESNSLVGVEIAEYFPKLNLLGEFGWTAQSAGKLFSNNTERWRFGPSLSWSFLNFGRVKQNVKAAEARAVGAAAAYQEAVLLALEDTENALAQFRAANQSRTALIIAKQNAQHASRLAKLRYDNGADDFYAYLDSERTRINAEIDDTQAQTTQATALARLYKSLAGDFAKAE